MIYLKPVLPGRAALAEEERPQGAQRRGAVEVRQMADLVGDRPARARCGELPFVLAEAGDDVVEGLELHRDDGRLRGFSVQYHPEAAAGPHDAAYLFDRFAEMMGRR